MPRPHMTRADFIQGVEKLLGKFAPDNYMDGFQEGYGRFKEDILEALGILVSEGQENVPIFAIAAFIKQMKPGKTPSWPKQESLPLT